MVKRTYGLILVAGLAALAAAAEDSYSLERVAKVGEEAEYAFTATLNIEDQKLTIEGKTRDVVKKVGDDKSIQYESTQFGVVIKTPDGGEMGDSSEESKTTITYGNDRVVKQYGTDPDPSSMRLALIATVKKPDKPVKVGDSWSTKFKLNKADTYEIKGDYTLLAIEKLKNWDVAKVKVSTKEIGAETPSSAEGTVWISLQDGSSIKESYKIKNATFPGVPVPIELQLELNRTK